MSIPRYQKYKESGVEWLGQVPEGWEVVQYKQFVDIQNGSDHKHVEQPEGYPVFGSGGIFAYASEFLYDGESVLLGRKGTIDKPLHVTGRFWTVDTMYWTKIRANTSGRYVYYLAVTIPFDYYSTNTALPSMTKGALNSHLVTLPPLPEQTTIAEFLDRETGKIDGLIAEQELLIELLTEEIKALSLVSFCSPKNGHVRLAEAVEVISRPVVQKSGEEYTRIGLFNRGRGLFHKDASETDDMGESDFFWIQEGDLIISGQFAWEGAVALATEEETGCVVSHRYPVLRGKAGVLLTEHLFALLMTKHGDFLMNEHSRGAAGRNRPLNINSLLKEKIPLPSLEEQEVVARVVHLKKDLMPVISRQVELLRERRTALISAAITGQIDVRGIQPKEAA